MVDWIQLAENSVQCGLL